MYFMYIKKNCVLLVAVTPEIYCIHGGPIGIFMEGKSRHNFLWPFVLSSIFPAPPKLPWEI